MFIYLFNLSQFLSFCQFLIGSSLRTVKNQDLIANYSMIERGRCFIQCLSVVTIYSEGNLSFAFPISFHFQCILTTENLQLSCYKHNIVVSYIVVRWIKSLRLLLYFLFFIFLPFLNASSAQKWKKTKI